MTSGMRIFVPDSDKRALHIAPLEGNLAVVITAGPHFIARKPSFGRFAACIPPTSAAVEELISYLRDTLRGKTFSVGYVIGPKLESELHRLASTRLIGQLKRSLGISLARRSYESARGIPPEDRAVTIFYPNHVFFRSHMVSRVRLAARASG